MSIGSDRPAKTHLTAYGVGVLGTLLIMAALVGVMYHFTRPEPVNQARSAERRKNLQELNAANAEALNNYAWQDRAKGIVRLPIERAKELIIQEYQNPAAARSNLLARAEKAAAAPPQAPKPANPFE